MPSKEVKQEPWPKANAGVPGALICENCAYIYKGTYCPHCGHIKADERKLEPDEKEDKAA